jgi:hypothetical protein
MRGRLVERAKATNAIRPSRLDDEAASAVELGAALVCFRDEP